MQKAVLESFPKADISVSIVWIEMLPTDNLSAVEKMAATIRDPRVLHFYDPRASRLAGQSFAKGLLKAGAGPAWDIYLFYDKAAEWKDDPPQPMDWMHQLSGADRADPTRFYTGENLVNRLRDAVQRMTQTEGSSGDK